jgi:hypothetical protein
MELAAYICGALVVVFGAILAIASLRGHLFVGLWFGVATIVAAAIGSGFWIHDFWQKTDDGTKNDVVSTTVPKLRLPLVAGKAADIDWTIKNGSPNALVIIGASTAVRITDSAETFQDEQRRHLPLAYAEQRSALLTPGDEIGCNVASKDAIDDATYNEIVNDKKKLFLLGVVLYEDSAGSLRASRYCYQFDVGLDRFTSGPPALNVFASKESREAISAHAFKTVVQEAGKSGPNNLLVPGNRPTPEWVVPRNDKLEAEKDVGYQNVVGKPNGVEEIPEDAVRFFIGSLLFWGNEFPVAFLRQGTEDLITFDLKEGGAVVTAKFFEADGKVACHIENNHFIVNPANYPRPDIVNDRTKLIVHDQYGKEVLNFEFINPKAIRIDGDFYALNGKRVVLKNGYTTIGDDRMWFGMAMRVGDSSGTAFVHWIDIPKDTVIPPPPGSEWIEIWKDGAPTLPSAKAQEDSCFVVHGMKFSPPEIGKRVSINLLLATLGKGVRNVKFKNRFVIVPLEQSFVEAMDFQKDEGFWQEVQETPYIEPQIPIDADAGFDPKNELDKHVLAGTAPPGGVVRHIFSFHAVRYTPEKGVTTTSWFASRYDAKTGKTEFLPNLSNIKYESLSHPSRAKPKANPSRKNRKRKR